MSADAGGSPSATLEVYVLAQNPDSTPAPEEQQPKTSSGLTGFILILCGLGLIAVVVIIVITIKKK